MRKRTQCRALAHRHRASPAQTPRVREPGNKTGQMAGHNRQHLATGEILVRSESLRVRHHAHHGRQLWAACGAQLL